MASVIRGSGASTLGGALDVQGVLTYEDVTSVDSIGIITARSGIIVGTGASIFSPDTNELTLGTNNVERLRIESGGNITATSRVDVGGLTADSNLTPTSGTSIEIFYGGSGGVIQTFDRDNSNTEPLRVRGSNWDIGYTGSASFAGGAFAIESDGDISTNVRGHGHIELDSTGAFTSPKIKLFSNTGAATFAGSVNLALLRVVASGTTYPRIIGTPDGTLYSESSSLVYPWQLNPNGSATFTGEINVGGYNGSSTTTDGVILGAVGGVYSQLAASAASSGVLWQGMHGSTFTSRIQASGAATFAGEGSFGGYIASTRFTVNGALSSNVNGVNYPFAAYDGSSNLYASINESGAATFNGVCKVNRTVSGDGCFHAALNGTVKASITSAGAFIHGSLSPGGGGGGYVSKDELAQYANSSAGSILRGWDASGSSNVLKVQLKGNGGIANYQSNDVNLCDEREKKNIVSLESKWDKVKGWELKKFHYNEDVDTDHLRYGVIAQQVEIENPELLTEWNKNEEVTRKGVKEQQMMWMAIKALQEAMTKIETLEAKVAALEGS